MSLEEFDQLTQKLLKAFDSKMLFKDGLKSFTSEELLILKSIVEKQAS